MSLALLRVALLSSLAVLAAFGCDRNVLVGRDAPAALGSGGAADAATETGLRDVVTACSPVWCDPKHLYQCGDCWDNDGDGLADMDDPDCLGPCQNTEESFSGAIPGQNHAACEQDCYFDPDSGSGNDGCVWSHRCDPLSVPPDYAPEGAQCAYPTDLQGQAACAAMQTQTDACRTACIPLTPNGCDCFGCCSIPGAPTPVWVGSTDALGNPTCNAASVANPDLCRPCTQVTSCLNTCDHCELCVGKRQLPSDCPTDGGCPTPVCPAGVTPCSPCLPPCPSGESCVTGCCVEPIR